MRESARPENHDWAKRMVRPFVREFPSFRSDIEGEALCGLVKAEQHPSCPGPEEFQQFAYPFVMRSANGFMRKLRRQNGKLCQIQHEDLIPGRKERPNRFEWREMRLRFARHLQGKKRRVFMRIYGIDEYRTLSQVATDLGYHLSEVKRLHLAALEAIRDLPTLHQVA